MTNSITSTATTSAAATMSLTATCAVTDVAFNNVTMNETMALVLLMVQKGDSPQHICTGNLDHLFLLQHDSEFRQAYASAALVVPDGMPVLWLSRLSGGRKNCLRERVAGSDLFWELARASANHGLRLFFLGGAPGAAQAAKEAVLRLHPEAQICGTYCPPFETFNTEEEQQKIEQMVREAAPDILLVGLGAPKQEKWILRHKNRLGVPVSIGVGGTFEMASGAVRRAPDWVQRAGMEWGYRMVQDPARLCRRYLGNDLPFLVRAAVGSLSVGVRRKLARRGSGTAVSLAVARGGSGPIAG